MKIDAFASGSSGNAYLISDGATTLLLDAGISLLKIKEATDFRVRDIKGCLISHSHKDHSKAAMDLAKAGVNIYTSRGTIKTCGLEGHRIHEIKALKRLKVGTFLVMPFDVEHDVLEPLGFLLESTLSKERLLYFTDTYYIKYRFERLNYIMCECNFSKEALQESIEKGYIPIELAPRLFKSHMSLETLIEMLKANDLSHLKQVYLLHLSANNSDEEHFKKEIQKVTGAEVYVC